MSNATLTINTILDGKVVYLPFNESTTAEDVCISICKDLGIGTVARHLFALRIHRKQTFLANADTFSGKIPAYELRIRFKVHNIFKLKKIDIKAYDYYFHQVRIDVLENRIPDLIYEKYKRELVGLGVTDMYRVMLEKDIPSEVVETDYKKYIPKEVIKRHTFFIKKPIRDTLGKIKRAGHDAWYVKAEYLKQLETMAPEYLSEEYKAFTDLDGIVSALIVKVSPHMRTAPGIKYCHESKRDNYEYWIHICTFDELGFVSIRKDGTVEISRKNGIPFYLKFLSLPSMFSFVSLLDGYYRLSYKWTFNICKETPTPSLQRLYNMRCHGPVGGEFSYAKLEEKCDNKAGCFILRESESKYNTFFIDVCTKNSLKPKTFKLERLPNTDYIFNDDPRRFPSIAQLVAAYNDPEGPIYLAECVPPSEYDKSPLLLCKRENQPGDAVTDGSFADTSLPHSPICINTKDLQVYKGRKCLKWDKNRSNIKTFNTTLKQDKFAKDRFPDESLSYAKKYCRNPDGDIGGPWCFVDVEDSDYIERDYCDIPFCDDQECDVFTRNYSRYVSYTRFQEKVENFTFGVKIWNPDSYIKASARLVLSLFALPLTGKELEDLGIGIEITLTNTKSGLTRSNKDEVEYEPTPRILKSTEYTFFSITWAAGFISLNRLNVAKPIFLAEMKTKKNLLGFKKDVFNFYAADGDNVLWTFPFCHNDGICDIHVTTQGLFQRFRQLRESPVGIDLEFFLKVAHSANLLLVPSPALEYPQILFQLGRNDSYTRVFATLHKKAPKTLLVEAQYTDLLSQWRWRKFSISLFGDTLHLHKTTDVGSFLLFEVKHASVRMMRWFSVNSDDTVAHWTFFCEPAAKFKSPQAWLPECALDETESNYVGTQDVTRAGAPCLPWAGGSLIPEKVRSAFTKKNELNQAWNYCRDPEKEKKGTYCYTIIPSRSPPVQRSQCKIRKCKSSECRMAGTGNDYIGKVNRTRSNRTCQHWSADFPAKFFERMFKVGNKFLPHGDIATLLSDPAVIEEVERANTEPPEVDINGTAVIATESSKQKGFLNKAKKILKGGRDTLIDHRTGRDWLDDFVEENEIQENMEWFNHFVMEYKLEQLRKTPRALGKLFAPRHVNMHLVNPQYFNTTLYADMSVEKAENFCRNPSRNIAGSWCYTLDPQVPRDICDIKDCDKPEECIIVSRGNGTGRELFILPQWKEEGIHGGLRFALKHWDPDAPDGLKFVIRSFKSTPTYSLMLGAQANQKIILLKNKHIVKEKAMPHLIPSGKWTSFWLQIRRGEFQLGFEGVPHSLFEWSENKTLVPEPIFVTYTTLDGNPMGIYFKCDECHTENTTVGHFSKIMPIGIWDRLERHHYTNLTLYIRGTGNFRIRLMHLPGSGDYYSLLTDLQNSKISFIKSIPSRSNTLKSNETDKTIKLLTNNTWTVYNVSFGEEHVKLTVNDSVVFKYTSSRPLLLYWFSISVEEHKGWVAWAANCEPLDIDGPPLDGGWSKWSEWQCSVTCGGGDGFRTRTCSNPRPNIFGRMCEGPHSATGRCNEFDCGDVSPRTMDMVRDHLRSINVSLVVYEGEKVTIENYTPVLAEVVRESPEGKLEWTLNGKIVSKNSRRFLDGDDITINKAHVNDTGVYVYMLYRISKERLVLHVVSLAVRTEYYRIRTRQTLQFTLRTHAVVLAYIYTDLQQLWLINNSTYVDYGITTLAAVSSEIVPSVNITHHGEWYCIIRQTDLSLQWITNVMKVEVRSKPNVFTHLREDEITKPIFGWMKTDLNVLIGIVLIVLFVCTSVAAVLFAYLKWGTLPTHVRKARQPKKLRRKVLEKGKFQELQPILEESETTDTTTTDTEDNSPKNKSQEEHISLLNIGPVKYSTSTSRLDSPTTGHDYDYQETYDEQSENVESDQMTTPTINPTSTNEYETYLHYDTYDTENYEREETSEASPLILRKTSSQKKEGTVGISIVYRSMWRHAKGKKVEAAMKILKNEHRDKYLKDFMDLAGQWACLQSTFIVRLYGVTLMSQISMVLEYVRFGTLDRYLRDNKVKIKLVDLIEASSNLASALWHLEENRIVHGKIRCRKLLVSNHDESSFIVKLSDGGIHTTYTAQEVHWIPIECYSNLEHAKKSPQADVWAYGTTLWEIFTYGETMNQMDHLETMRLYANGKRLTQPAACPNDIYQMMRECWEPDPHRRRQPQSIMRDINQIMYQVYNSRRTHAYAKLKHVDDHQQQPQQQTAAAATTTSTTSLFSNATESTCLGYQDELLSMTTMSEVDSDLSSTSSFGEIGPSFGRGWISHSDDLLNQEDSLSCDFSNILSNFHFSTTTATTSLDSINSMQSIFELDDDCNVILQGRIGQGFYGEVYKGSLEHIGDKEAEPKLVAIKKLKKAAMPSCVQDFEREISIMKGLKHPNIVEILGVLQEPEVSLVMEFVHHGSLQSYLKIYRETLTIKQLLNYALDITKGMEYLGKKNIVHRDLAARNILVVDENHVKISDFGLAQFIGANDYYILKTNRELPIKWYALESLRDGKFSPRSDVWSYGVTMCEMFSYGEEPVLPITQEKVEGQEQQILLNALESGARFPCPPVCPQSVYVRIIYPCWLVDPHTRLTFTQLCAEIIDLLLQY